MFTVAWIIILGLKAIPKWYYSYSLFSNTAEIPKQAASQTFEIVITGIPEPGL